MSSGFGELDPSAARVAGPVPAEDGRPGRLDREEVYSGRIVRLSLDSVCFPGGSEGRLELIRHPGAAAVLPLLDPPDSTDPRVMLIRQYRYAAGGYVYEVPAGMPDHDEEPWDECARRELAEETGYRAGSLRYLTRIFTTPGFTDEVIHLFVAGDLQEGDTDRDADEFLSVGTVRLSQAVQGVARGLIVDGKSVATLLFADRFLQEAWTAQRTVPSR
jgi:ADP-ribose pyrophosphatase